VDRSQSQKSTIPQPVDDSPMFLAAAPAPTQQAQPALPATAKDLKDVMVDGFFANLPLIAIMLSAIVYRHILEPWWLRQKLTILKTEDQDKQIDQQLVEALTYSQADRILLVEATNGTYTNSRRSLKGLAITGQKTIDSIKNVNGDGLLTQDQVCIGQLFDSLEKNRFNKRLVAEIADDAYRLYLQNLDVYFVIYIYLSVEDLRLGFIALHYCSPSKWIDWDAADEWTIANQVTKITSIIYNNKLLMDKMNSLAKRGV
jgi:hypothetical protein